MDLEEDVEEKEEEEEEGKSVLSEFRNNRK